MENMDKDMMQAEEKVAEKPTPDMKPKNTGSKTIAALIIILAIIIGAGYYFRGALFAATVNGSSISRLAVMKELEKQGGGETLDILITQKLIEQEGKAKGIEVTNADIEKEIDDLRVQMNEQGANFDEVLAAQGLTIDDVRFQFRIQKLVEGLLGDKIAVSDEDIDNYINLNQITIEAGKEDEVREQAQKQVRQQKLNTEASTQAEITYYGLYLPKTN